MSESLKSEAEDYATSKYPPCFMKINGEFSNDVNFPRRKSAEEHFIAGHQSAERKSEDKLLESQLALKDCVAELHKTREMVRELVGALREDRRKIQEITFEEILTKYATEIEQLGREQNGATNE